MAMAFSNGFNQSCRRGVLLGKSPTTSQFHFLKSVQQRSLSITSTKSSNEVGSISIPMGDKSMDISTGRLARMADGSALVHVGGMSVLATVVSSHESSQMPFLPLRVDYRERADAARRIVPTFLRRELRPTEKEVLACRIIDRSLRPCFSPGYSFETQIICNLLSLDSGGDPEVVSINGASAALCLSDVPWVDPVGAVRVCLLEDKLVVNPHRKLISSAAFNIVVACTNDRIVMAEGFGKQVHVDRIAEAVALAQEHVRPFLQSLSDFQSQHGKRKRECQFLLPTNDLYSSVHRECYDKILVVLTNVEHSKTTRDTELFRIRDEAVEAISTSGADPTLLKIAFWDVCRDCTKHIVLDKGVRCDGRGVDDLRPIDCEVDAFPSLHGSALFRRGETEVLCTTTFASLGAAAKTDTISLLLGGQRAKKFMLHYDFPPFATNTISKGAFFFGRREIGHGMLAERALQGVIPNDFPFTIRLASQVLDSNGSSSMATVCGGSLALFDAGVAILQPVGGVACGLISRQSENDDLNEYSLLTDILGIEDALGNMDFKIAGTREGITALQFDVKGINGIPVSVFEEALGKGKAGIGRVLDIMDSVQSAPRPEMKDNSPAYETIQVPIMKRSRILGVGGHKLRALSEETGAEITTISDNMMSVFAPTNEAMEETKERIEALLKNEDEADLQFGLVYQVKIVDIRNYGAVVEFVLPNSDKRPPSALLHLSQMDHKMVRHPSVLGLKRGDVIDVKYLGRDPVTEKNRVSRKALLDPPKRPTENEALDAISTFSDLQKQRNRRRS